MGGTIYYTLHETYAAQVYYCVHTCTDISVSVFAAQSTRLDGSCDLLHSATNLCCSSITVFAYMYVPVNETRRVMRATDYTLQHIYVARVLLCLHTCISVFLYSPPNQRDGSYNLLHSATSVCCSGSTGFARDIHALITQSVSVLAAPSTRSVMQSTTLFNRSVLLRYYYVTLYYRYYTCTPVSSRVSVFAV